MDEPRSHGRGRAGNVLGAVDDDLPGAVAILTIGGVDDHLRPQLREQVPHGPGVADLDPLPRCARFAREELRAEEPACTRDVDPHSGSGADCSGGAFLSRHLRTSSIAKATENAIPSPTRTPFHGCCSNCLPPM